MSSKSKLGLSQLSNIYDEESLKPKNTLGKYVAKGRSLVLKVFESDRSSLTVKLGFFTFLIIGFHVYFGNLLKIN